MKQQPIQFQSIILEPMHVHPFTHKLIITSHHWTHESHLELPNLTLEIHPRFANNYILACADYSHSYAEPFDSNLANFAGCISTVAKAFGDRNPVACKHLLQGVSNATIYFARMYGYVDFDIEEGVVTATTKRDQ